MRRIAHLCSIGPGTRLPSLTLIGSGGVRPPLRKDAWPLRSDVASGIQIGIQPVAARHASERRLIGAVGAGRMAATRAGLARVARVAEHNRDAKPSRLVLDEVNQ